MLLSEEKNILTMRQEMETYSPISDETWGKFRQFCNPIRLKKDDFFAKIGNVSRSFGFVSSGLLRAFITDQKGNEYNKIFFFEKTFPGSMVALLTGTPSLFSIQALEDCRMIEIDFKSYRKLLSQREDLKLFHLLYLEKNWVIEKEKREISLVQDSATERYLSFLANYPSFEKRIPQYHIASHLGITPTQLSRIRKKLIEKAT